MSILITAVGKRVQLIKHLKETYSVIGCDCSKLVPAAKFCDSFELVPRCDDPDYISALFKICQQHSIKAVIPLYEQEFPILSEARELFENQGIKLILSSEQTLNICSDKWNSYNFFIKNNISTPASFLSKDNVSDFPLFIKPRSGMGSIGAHKLHDQEELNFYFKRVHNPIIQECLHGQEYTIDCFCDSSGAPFSIVPRQRIEVISGEVSKTKTVNDVDIITETKKLLSCLRGIGPLTVQCFKCENGNITFTEVNPRFGGGVPGTFAAGINYGKLLQMLIDGESASGKLLTFPEVTMLRFSDAVYL